MQTLFKLAYGLAVAILFVLFVILGTQTFYEEPEAPEFPRVPPPVRVEPPPGPGERPGAAPIEEPLFCEPDGRCFKGGRELTPEDEAKLTDDEKRYVREQREFQQRQQKYEDERADYFRNVFIVASVLGVLAIGAGIYLFFRRVEAMPLGLLLGGIGVVIYGWVESARGPDEAVGTAPLFAVVAAGLLLILAAGYRFLGLVRPADGEGD